MLHKKHFLLFIMMVCLLSAKVTLGSPADSTICDSNLWPHVYHSYRLVVHDSCTFVTGIVQSDYSEADGDYHIRIKLDTQYNYMLNSLNISSEYGDLVCEPICAATITQSDAVAPCAGLTNNVYLPNVGEYVKVTGPYVTDNDHGWNEIHPVTKIEIIAPTQIGAVNGTDIVIKTFPVPANDYINFSLSTYPDAPIQIILSDALGRSAGQYQMLNTLQLKVNTDWFPAGMYYYTILQKSKLIKTGTFAVAH